MRRAEVYNNGTLAGILIEENRSRYMFRYDMAYYLNSNKSAISLTLPKSKQEHVSECIFPFFSSLIAEGSNLAIQESYLKIDERDVMSLLGATAEHDTIGAITLKLISDI